MRKHIWSTVALLVLVILAFGSFDDGGTGKSGIGGAAPDKPKSAEETRQERISAGFSAWDGSHIQFTELIKRLMNNPSSYEHVETRYVDGGDYLIVITEFRGTNAFGGVIPNTMAAKIDLDGHVINVIPEGDLLTAVGAARKDVLTNTEEARAAALQERKREEKERAEDAKRQEKEKLAEADRERLKREKGLSDEQAEMEYQAAIENAKFRIWTSADANFSTEAKIISYGNGIVTLEKRDGKKIRVRLEKLSESDRTFINSWRRLR
jgi:hypothetical protein